MNYKNMMHNNHKKSGCGFDELLVSYLYGETNAAENAKFAAHLETCAGCADELEAFAGVKFSVGDWKSMEFAALETPVIEIPYEKSATEQIVAGGKASLLHGLLDLFSLSPAWSLATASLALLAVCTGIALFAMNSSKDNDIAGQGNKPLMPASAPTLEKAPENSNNRANENKNPENEVKPAVEQKNPPAETAVAPDAKNKKPVNKSNVRRQPQKPEAANTPKPVDSKRSLKNSQQVAPKIIEEEEEDDTLRLAELFEEIDTVE